MKIFFFTFFLVWLQCCYAKPPNNYAHSSVSKFGNENTLKCPKGGVYILQCQIKCMNHNNEIIYKECLKEVETKCKDKGTCSYYFDYVFNKKFYKLRSNNSIYVDDCIDSDENEIKSTFTCALNRSLEFDNNNNVMYYFMLNNKNTDKIVCKNSNIYINNATIHYAIEDKEIKDITAHVKKQCNERQSCVINPYSIQTDILNEKDENVLLNSYASISFACLKVSPEVFWDGEDIDEFEQINDQENEDSDYLDNDDSDESNEEIISIKNEINEILNDEKIDTVSGKLKIAKLTVSKKIISEIKKKDDIFNNLASDFSKYMYNEYSVSDIKDMLEDRYNELNKTAESDLYYIYLLNTFDIENKFGAYFSSYQEKLQEIVQTHMINLYSVEKNIGKLRNMYISLYKKAQKYNILDLFDEDYDLMLNYDDFAKDSEIITADIFIKSEPEIPEIILQSDNENKFIKYKDIEELDELDNLNRTSRIIDIRNFLVKRLKMLYNQRNNAFIKQAMLVKSYCYKNQINVTNFSSLFKNNYIKLKQDAYKKGKTHVDIANKINPYFVVNYLDNLYKQHVNKSYILSPWNSKSSRMHKKIKIILTLGYSQIIQLEKQIHRHMDKYNALLEKATLYNLDNLFTETSKTLNEIIVSIDEIDDNAEVIGDSSSPPTIHDTVKEDETEVAKAEEAEIAKGAEQSEQPDEDEIAEITEDLDEADNEEEETDQSVTGTDNTNHENDIDNSIKIIKYSKAEENEYDESNENDENDENENEKNNDDGNISNASSASLSNIIFTFIIAVLFFRQLL
ncbi:surface protein P113, putative [Plasmodium vinckei lentum]|uniref:Surface protein P113, putative n=1 Tax=Plasmodium vinckei lentum TaxID=138297 RepID=A0A6V7S755_PLAVN|nr:surface protein P113, putative [Plasmodium vinckei lentum]